MDTPRQTFTTGTFPIFHYGVMEIGNHGVGIRDVMLGIGNDGVGG
jgi:hypothetical protein